jgi:hypothetical protein
LPVQWPPDIWQLKASPETQALTLETQQPLPVQCSVESMVPVLLRPQSNAVPVVQIAEPLMQHIVPDQCSSPSLPPV